MIVSIGEKAPSFTLYDQNGNQRNLDEFSGKTVVLAFFPAAFTNVCRDELCTFRDQLTAFSEINAQVIGISVDSRFSNAEFAKQNKIEFPILSDYMRAAIKIYGVEWPDLAGMEGYVSARRSVFIIDKDQIVRWRWLSDKPTDQPPYEAVKAETGKIS